jgi:hypothetical protein
MASCDHPRPPLNMPGYTPPRFSWQPPAVLPTDPAAMARALTEAFRGIYSVLQQLGQRRAVVPLIEDIDAREGQVIVGVADGQVIRLPEGIDGSLGQVGIVLTDVVTPITVLNPDGTTTSLGQAGAYDFITGTPEVYQTNPGGVVIGGSIPTDRLLGRDSPGTGAVEYIQAGTGLEFSGAGSVRIAAAAAGAGLTGGSGSALAVGAGAFITVNVNDVEWTGAGAFLNDWLVPIGTMRNIRFDHSVTNTWAAISEGGDGIRVQSQRAALTGAITASANSNATLFDTNASGAGLTGGGTAILAVGAGTGITVNANDVAVTIPLTDGDKGDVTVSSSGTVWTVDSDWADILANGNNTGAFNPHIDDGQFLGFGVEGSLPGSGDIRSSDAFTINVTGAAALVGSTTASVTGGGSNGLAAAASAVILGAGTSGITISNNSFARISTGGSERLEIEATGAWQLGGLVGTAGQYMRSAGAGASPAWASLALSELPSQAADTFLGRLAGAGTPAAQLLSDVDSASIVYDAASHTFQRPALTGAVTASQDSNATAFGALAAKSVLANATNASAVPAALAGSAAFQHLRVNSANTALEWSALTSVDFPANTVPLTSIQTQAAETFLGNFTAGVASPTARLGSAVAGGGLTYTAGGTLAVGAGTHITVNADDVTINLSTLTGAIDSASVVQNGTVLERAALTGDVTASQNSNATTIANDAVTNAKMANMAAARVKGVQVDGSTGDPQDLTGAEVFELLRASTVQDISSALPLNITLNADTTYLSISTSGDGEIQTISGAAAGRVVFVQLFNFGTKTIKHSTGANGVICPGLVDFKASVRDSFWLVGDAAGSLWMLQGGPPFALRDGDKGDITLSSQGATWAIDANAVSDTKLRDSAALSVIGRASSSSGDPADIAATNGGQVLRANDGLTAISFSQLSTAGMANNAVDNTKLDNMVEATIKGRAAGAGTGDPQDLTAAQVATIVGGVLVAYTQYTTGSGTHTYNALTKFRIAELVGGGGAGGGTIGGAGGTSAAGGGGQAGSCEITSGTVTGGAGVAYAVGALGAGVSGANGNAGSDTTLAGATTAAGGDFGNVGTAAAGANRADGGGNNATSPQGSPGLTGFALAGAVLAIAGAGGNGPDGGGGFAPTRTTAGSTNGSSGRGAGSGGSGAANLANGGNGTGGSGFSGRIRIWEYS